MENKQSSSPASFIGSTVIPGDVVLDLSSMTNQTIKLDSRNQISRGLRVVKRDDEEPGASDRQIKIHRSVQFGSMPRSLTRCFIDYLDAVLGIVVDSKRDDFLIDIKGPALAFLPVLSFEGGTRRNIPKFEVGTLLYLRVVKAKFGMNPELSCTNAHGKAAEFGPLKDGYMFETSTGLSRKLLSSPTCPVLESLGKKLCFEIAVGLNGRVWVNAASPRTVIVAANAIMNSES
ncbi:hypothetical protein GQ457_17G016670 [Hibiscus cannabinus]